MATMYNLAKAVVAPGNVLPQSLSTSFLETNLYPMLAANYNDGTSERSLIEDGVNAPRALRTWILAKRLPTSKLTALWNFWQQVMIPGPAPFYFYSPIDVAPGQRQGSNWDATGSNTQGRATVFFRGDWSQQTPVGGIGLDPSRSGRHIVGNLTLVEVA